MKTPLINNLQLITFKNKKGYFLKIKKTGLILCWYKYKKDLVECLFNLKNI